jgi:uncharacterized protein YycO
MTAPQAGDIGVTPSRGFVAWAIRAITGSPHAAHAFLATGDGTQIIEGDPHGARLNDAGHYRNVTWLTNLSAGMADAQRELVVAWARAHLGTPYSWIDDAEIGLVRVFHWAPGWMRRRLRSDRTLMCSQLCDAAYHAAGVDLFTDGRPAGGVSPGDLWRLNRARSRTGP